MSSEAEERAYAAILSELERAGMAGNVARIAARRAAQATLRAVEAARAPHAATAQFTPTEHEAEDAATPGTTVTGPGPVADLPDDDL